MATVTVHITDIFDFNIGDRGLPAEKLTAIGRQAEMAVYNVDVTYTLHINVVMSEANDE
jgi:hypothetical protein